MRKFLASWMTFSGHCLFAGMTCFELIIVDNLKLMISMYGSKPNMQAIIDVWEYLSNDTYCLKLSTISRQIIPIPKNLGHCVHRWHTDQHYYYSCLNWTGMRTLEGHLWTAESFKIWIFMAVQIILFSNCILSNIKKGQH